LAPPVDRSYMVETTLPDPYTNNYSGEYHAPPPEYPAHSYREDWPQQPRVSSNLFRLHIVLLYNIMYDI
jgi:hypothetical protein